MTKEQEIMQINHKIDKAEKIIEGIENKINLWDLEIDRLVTEISEETKEDKEFIYQRIYNTPRWDST